MFEKAKKIAVLSLCCLIAGCATTKKMDYEKFKTDRPSEDYMQVGSENFDETNKKISIIYKETNKLLDDYVKFCDNNRTYIAYTNDTSEMSESEKEEYLASLSPEVQQEVADSLEANENMSWNSNLKRALKLLKDSNHFSSSAQGALEECSGFSPDMLKKARATKHGLSQLDYSVDALNFLIKQYKIMQRAKETNIR